MMNRIRTMSLALATVLAAGAAFAGPLTPPSGPISSTMKTLTEVEPRIAINATNTPGDNDSSPSVYKITQPGSYYLTGNVVGVAGRAGIEIVANNVTLDLNGFTIEGGMYGVAALSLQGVTIRNGVISGTSNAAVRASGSTASRFESLTVRSSGGLGIDTGADSTVEKCTVKSAQLGIRVGSNSLVTECLVAGATNAGFLAGTGASGMTFRSCTASGCGGEGFSMLISANGRIIGCTSTANASAGFTLGDRFIITDSIASGNTSHGISVGVHSVAKGNLSANNGVAGVQAGHGINVHGSGAVVEGNRLAGNYGNGVNVQSGVADTVIIGNWTRNNSSGGFLVPSGNELAPIITNPGSNNYSGATPFSNFVY